jgi:hypothetical protein
LNAGVPAAAVQSVQVTLEEILMMVEEVAVVAVMPAG